MGGGGSASKTTKGSSAKIQGFTSKESKEIAKVEKLFRKSDLYKSRVDEIKNGYAYETAEKLSHSAVYTGHLEDNVSHITVFDLDLPDFNAKQTKYVVDEMRKELGVDHPKWKKYRK